VGVHALEVARPHGQQAFLASAVWVDFSHAALHRQLFLVESGGRAVDVTGAGGQEHRHPLRRERVVDVVDLHQLARHAGLRHVRVESGAADGSDADEDERAEARRVLIRLWVEKRKFRGAGRGSCRA
jgi:CO dehydrogenase/acetyl-CoA synthase gamma subunit (corrinoid Fe-S protein)